MDDKFLRIVSIGWAWGGSLGFPLAIAALLVALCGCRPATSEDKTGQDDAASAGVTVRVEPAVRRSMTETIDGLGRCEALPGRIATLTPAVEGRILKILISPAADVSPGEPIIQLDSTIANADLREKITTCDALQAALRQLQMLPRPEEREGRKLAIEAAKVALSKAEAAARRLRPLRDRKEIPEQQMFEADLTVTQARLQLRMAESDLAAFLLGPRPAAVDEAKAHIAAATAAVNSAQAKVDLHTIRSPISGVLDSLICRLGQTVASGAALGEIVDSRQVYAVVWLPVDAARCVRKGQTARVRVAGISSDRTITAGNDNAAAQQDVLPGRVELIGRIADPQTGNLPVRILVENPQGRLIVGQTLAVAITTCSREKVLAVPAAAIDDLGEGPLLHVVRRGKAVVLHPRLGQQDGGAVEVLKTDLQPGEPVVVEGGYNLPDGTEVKVRASGAESEGGKLP